MKYSIPFLVLFLSVSQLVFASSNMDSLRMEKIKGKKYIIHRADPQETLYSITKRYGVTLEEIYEYNPSLKENGLKMFDTIQIPVVKKKKNEESVQEIVQSSNIHIVQAGETLFAISRKYGLSVDSLTTINQLENANLSIGDTLYLEMKKTVVPTNIKPALATYHIVQPSETLFGISRTHQVEIEDIQKWNNLPDFNLSIGQKLIVSNLVQTTSIDSIQKIVAKPIKDSVQAKIEKPALDTLYVKTDNSQFKTKTQEVEGKKQTLEEGFAMQIEDTDYTKKFLALHRTAPLGSTIKVQNQMNKQIIEARVVGKLPESALNQNLLIRLSSAAYKAMGAIDLKTPITVSYSSDAE